MPRLTRGSETFRHDGSQKTVVCPQLLMSIDIANLRKLPVADKLRIVTQLWDDIAASTDPLVVPPDVIREAARRSAELKAHPSIAIDDDELWRRVDG